MEKLKGPSKSRDNTEQGLRIAVKLNHLATKGLRELRGLHGVGTPGETFPLLPLMETVTQGQIEKLIHKARQFDLHTELPDFSSWHQVICPGQLQPEDLVNAIRELAIVETAYVMRPVPPPVNPSNNPRSSNEGYLDAAKISIDALYAWGFPGGDGKGIGFVDLEQGWNLQHEDLAAARITLISGINNAYFRHGTSVLGQVLMVDNNVGGVGIAPSASGRVVSQWRTAGSASPNNPEAIVSAASKLSPGDVLLLEVQELDPAGAKSFWPAEIADATYEAIQLATTAGIVVIEAGANGAHDLNTYQNLSGKAIFDRTSPDFRDSGAIMVAAATSAYPHTPLGYSNHGNRIDCYAWGENIDTADTNAARTDNTAYTPAFAGTSGASAIIAGAAIIVQGLAKAAGRSPFRPPALRQILTTYGTASAAPATDGIGVMPDLRAIIASMGLNPAADFAKTPHYRALVNRRGSPGKGNLPGSLLVASSQAGDGKSPVAGNAGDSKPKSSFIPPKL
jgi:hypothetical protein